MNELRLADWEVAVASWDYDSAVERTRPLVLHWTRACIELYRELYLAREALSRKGSNFRPQDGETVKTWTDFCTEIGYTRQAVHARLKNFVPAELSSTGEDMFLIEDKPSKLDREAKSLVKIQQFRSTGIRPEDWTDEDEALLRRLDAEARAAETAHQAVAAGEDAPENSVNQTLAPSEKIADKISREIKTRPAYQSVFVTERDRYTDLLTKQHAGQRISEQDQEFMLTYEENMDDEDLFYISNFIKTLSAKEA